MHQIYTRGQTRYVIPAWKVGDRVEHKGTGIVGTVKEFATAGHELVKVRFDGCGGRLTQVHASDLVVFEAGIDR